jgi:hypothetical protein
MHAFRAVLVAAVLVTTACSDPTSPLLPETDGLAFTDAHGRAFASAGFPSFSQGDVAAVAFAVAFPDSLGGLVIAGFDHAGGTRGDLFVLQLSDDEPALFQGCGDAVGECHGRLLLDIDAANVADYSELWELIDGSVTIAASGSDVVAGTFSGFVYAGPNDAETALHVEAGSFEVPLLSEAAGREIMQCFLARAAGETCD